MESSTQSFLKVRDIKDGVLILDNGDLRGILEVSPVNFALKSEEDQMALMYGFQIFVNSLDFFCQIVIQSRAMNISAYIDRIHQLEENQPNELLKTMTSSYGEFIKELVKGENVMAKKFYLVVPYSPREAGIDLSQQKSFWAWLMGKKSDAVKQLKEKYFEKCRAGLMQRVELATLGMKRCQLEAFPLSTEEAAAMLWQLHHPSEAETGYAPQTAPELLS